ncbi:MAG: hypothetical protein IT438_08745 [Phycisphaerales bacterium]|nr:hypothetical protein [Phycisphaerales bacterium]
MKPDHSPSPRPLPLIAALACAAAFAGAQGCQLVGFVGASVGRASDHDVKARYTGLADKNFAVIVAADRAIQADYPDIMSVITGEVTRRLADPKNAVGAAGMVAAEDVLKFQYQQPSWVTLSPTQIAEKLGVERLVFIDLQEFRLTDPGNPYLWNGRASASISVAETENDLGVTTAFREFISVKYPDNDSSSPQEIPSSTVQIVLLKRFVDRASWLFYDHEEANIIKY